MNYFNVKDLINFRDRIITKLIGPLRSTVKTCFVVGCGHSGTTLVSAKLGNHSKVYSIGRETGIFGYKNSISIMRIRCRFKDWFKDVEAMQKTFLLEKTPKHILHIERIKMTLPDSKFIVTLRNPLDNVASLYKRYGDLDLAVNRWNKDNLEVIKFFEDKNVLVIRYEDITTNPSSEFRKICDFIGVEWEEDILKEGHTVYDNESLEGNMLIRQAQVKQKIYSNVGKWKDILTEKQEKFVRNQTQALEEKLFSLYCFRN